MSNAIESNLKLSDLDSNFLAKLASKGISSLDEIMEVLDKHNKGDFVSKKELEKIQEENIKLHSQVLHSQKNLENKENEFTNSIKDEIDTRDKLRVFSKNYGFSLEDFNETSIEDNIKKLIEQSKAKLPLLEKLTLEPNIDSIKNIENLLSDQNLQDNSLALTKKSNEIIGSFEKREFKPNSYMEDLI